MKIEILFSEVCNFFGEPQNATYLKESCPDAEIIYTTLDEEPFFVHNDVDFLTMGAMSESVQRKVLEKLSPYKARLEELCEKGTVMLFTGNAGDIFCEKIDYVAEKISVKGLGFFPMTVRTDWFKRVNGKIIGTFENMIITGFRSQFAEYQGDNSSFFFVKAERGFGINEHSLLEGMRKNNLICTQIIGPILPLNPDFCSYLLKKTGCFGDNNPEPAFYKDAKAAFEKRVAEFRSLDTKF